MKLVIDIPEKTIAHIRSDYGHGYKGLYDEDRDIIVNAIYKAHPYVKFGAYIDGYLKALEGKEWIPVIEKLPEDKQKVLCCVTNEKHSVVIMYFEDASYWHDGKISAWMPCPEPYGGDV